VRSLVLLLLLQALNLIKAGYKVVVWNRSADKCEPLKAAGATVSGSSSS
jgi:3-hydroxyisobutyrate dehydrogenase